MTLGEVGGRLEGAEGVVEGAEELERAEGVAARPARLGAIVCG